MKIIEKHPLWLRLVHWMNVPLLLMMIWSGMLIYWANDIYPFFFPEWFYNVFHLRGQLAEGLAVHFFFAWFFILNSTIYVTRFFTSGHWREILPDRQSFKLLVPTLLHDIGLNRAAPPQGKFNAAQQLAYSCILILGLLIILTGLSIYKPVQLWWLAALFGGYITARLIHFAVTILFCGFIALHLIQVMRAGWNNFRAMIAGYEVKNDSRE